MVFGAETPSATYSRGQAWRRATAIFVIFVFTLFDAVRYAPQGYANPAAPIADPAAASFSIPKELGKIDEVYFAPDEGLAPFSAEKVPVPFTAGGGQAPFLENKKGARPQSGKTVIFIQDAHDSLEAQENIAKIINLLVKEKGIKTVFEEGYEGPVPTDKFFGFIKDPKIKQKVSYFLLDKLRVGGAEYAHINRATRSTQSATMSSPNASIGDPGLDSRLRGNDRDTEDWQLIGVEDLKLYGENIKYYQESSKNRKDIEEDLGELFSRITTLADQYFPKDLKTWLKRKELFGEGKLPLLDYLKDLRRLSLRPRSGLATARREGSNPADQFSEKYPAASLLITVETAKDKKLIVQLNALDSKVIFEEITQLEKDISTAFLQNERDQKIFVYYQGLSLLKKLNRIELTQAEYEAAKEILQKFETLKLVDFIVSLTRRSLVLSKEWEQHIKDAVRFYDVAHQRDGAIDQHIRTFQQSKEEAAILVFGGFHASAIKDMLRQYDFSYVVISPKITAIDKRHQDYYQRLMSEGHHAFEMPFLAARANKPPSAFFMATTAGDLPVEQELHAITSSVEMLGGNADPQIIERRLVSLSPTQVVRSISTATEKSKPRSEMRKLEFTSDAVQSVRSHAEVRQRKFHMKKWVRTILTAGILALAPSSIEKVFGQEATPAVSAVSVSPKEKAEISRLIRDFQSSSSKTRNAAVAALVKIGKPTVEPLIEILNNRNENYDAREATVEALSQMADASLVEPLLKIIYGGDYYSKEAVVKVLEKIRDAEAVLPLIQALSSINEDVCIAAAKVLGKIGDERAIEPLIKAVNHNHFSVYYAAKNALIQIGDPAVKWLVKVLENKDSRQKIRIIQILENIGSPDAVRGLIKALDDENAVVRSSAAVALAALAERQKFIEPLITESFAKLLNDKDEETGYEAAHYLGVRKDVRAIQPLVKSLSGNSWNREEAGRLLIDFGKPAVEPLIDVLTYGNSGYYVARKHAAEILSKIKDPRAVDPLVTVLTDKASESSEYGQAKIVNAVMTALHAFDTPKAKFYCDLYDGNVAEAAKFPQAVDVAHNLVRNASEKVRDGAMKVLIYTHQYNNLDRLKYYWADSPFMTFAASAFILLSGFYFLLFAMIQITIKVSGHYRVKGMQPILLALLRWFESEDMNWVTILYDRGNVTRALGSYGQRMSDKTVLVLINLVTKTSWASNVAAVAAIEALGKSLHPKALSCIINALSASHVFFDDFKPQIQNAAANALLSMGTPEALFYVRLFGNEADLAYSIALKMPEGFNHLQTALIHKNSMIRSSAAQVLGKMKNDAAAPALIERLGDDVETVRSSAAVSLGQLSEPSAQFYHALYFHRIEAAAKVSGADKLLEEALKHKNIDLQRHAVLVGAEFKLERFVPNLIDALADKDASYQALAVVGLGKIPTHEANFYFYLHHKESYIQ